MAIDARIKSLFLMPALAVTALATLGSLVMMALSSGYRLEWLGAALASAALPLVVVRLMVRPVARTSEYLPFHLLLGIGGTALAGRSMFRDFMTSLELYREIGGAFLSALNPTAGNLPGLVAFVSLVLLLLYLFWYSSYGRFPDSRLDVGSKLPLFEVTDLDGKVVKSTDFLGSPAVFLFFRGNWCPLCMAQIGELKERYQELERLGVQVCLISPQHAEDSRALAERMGVNFNFLVDVENRAATELGIAVANGVPVGVPGDYPDDTVMPTLFVTTAGGTIVFSDQTDNYRVRPEPDIFLAILRRSEAVA